MERKRRRRVREQERKLEVGVVESSWIIQLEVRGLILHLILLGFDRYILDLGGEIDS